MLKEASKACKKWLLEEASKEAFKQLKNLDRISYQNLLEEACWKKLQVLTKRKLKAC